MLVLTRRTGESIMLGDDTELKILKIKGSQVHIGIDAPSSTTVHRKEVWERIRREQAEPQRSPLKSGPPLEARPPRTALP